MPTSLQKRLDEIIYSTLGPEGAVVRLGGRSTPEQVEYARSVANVLCSDPVAHPAVGLIEAETGIGKSLGYLVPCLAYLALRNLDGPKALPRIIVSTHTRALQRQILEMDAVFAARILRESGVEPPSWAFRMGMDSFWAPERVADHIAHLKETHPERGVVAVQRSWDQVLAAAHESCRTGTGLWVDYVATHFTWPIGVSSKDVCLLAGLEGENARYEEHKVRASDAQLVITNHATTLMCARHNSLLGEDWDAIIVDEAHAIPRAAEGVAATRLQILEVVRVASRAGDMFPTLHRPKRLMELGLSLDAALRRSRPAHNPEVVLRNESLSKRVGGMIAEASGLASALAASCRDRILIEKATREEASLLADLEYVQRSLQQWTGTSPEVSRGIAYSSVRGIPSLMSSPINPGTLMRGIVGKRTRRAVFTSATMSDIVGSSPGFTAFVHQVGMRAEWVVTSRILSPARYGHLEFVLSGSDVPKPFTKDADDASVLLSPAWLSHAAGMIREAAGMGTTLVLTSSFAETEALAALLGDLPVLEHRAGESVFELVPDFQRGRAGVLLTPAAWEGVSFQTPRGGQLVRNLVITRVPFVSHEANFDALRYETLLERGLSDVAARSVLYMNRSTDVGRKLRQGIGRAIRGPGHRVTVWFCDPRMPAEGATSGISTLRGAIPARFRAMYANARVISPTMSRGARKVVMRGGR